MAYVAKFAGNVTGHDFTSITCAQDGSWDEKAYLGFSDPTPEVGTSTPNFVAYIMYGTDGWTPSNNVQFTITEDNETTETNTIALDWLKIWADRIG